MNQKQLVWYKMILHDFLECLETLIACIVPRRTFHFPSKVCTKGIMDIPLRYLKLWSIIISRFSMLSL
jgi:hypothetical protein